MLIASGPCRNVDHGFVGTTGLPPASCPGLLPLPSPGVGPPGDTVPGDGASDDSPPGPAYPLGITWPELSPPSLTGTVSAIEADGSTVVITTPDVFLLNNRRFSSVTAVMEEFTADFLAILIDYEISIHLLPGTASFTTFSSVS